MQLLLHIPTESVTLYEHADYKGNSFVVTPRKYNIGEIREKIGNDVISSVELCEGKQLSSEC